MDNIKNILVAERIKELMKDAGLKQKQFAEKIGVGQSTISEWLTKTNEPSINSLWLIADYFSVTVDYLIGRAEY